jgi:hypothetical protein
MTTRSTGDTRQCDCGKPFPRMIRLGSPGLDRYYLCPECGTVRLELASAPGLIDEVRFLALGNSELPEAVWIEARSILARPEYQQRRLL